MTIYVDDEVYCRVRELAAKDCVTVSKFVEQHLIKATRYDVPRKPQLLRQSKH